MMKTLKITKKFYPAALWKRVIAYFLDSIIINIIILYPFNKYLSNIGNDIISILKSEIQLMAVATVSIILITYLYFALLELTTKQTIGKMVMNIYVASLRKKLSITQILLRNITKPFTIILAVDTLYMIFKKINQRLFDVFSGTVIVEQGVIMK